MTPLRLALLQLRRSPHGTALAVALLALTVWTGLAGRLLAQAAADQLGATDPAVDVIIGGKSSPTRLWMGALQAGPYTLDVLSGDTALPQIDAEVGPTHRMRLARFGEAGGHPAVGVDAAFFERPEGVPAPTLAQGRLATGDDEAVVGADVARAGVGVGDELALASDGRIEASALGDDARVRVVGVLAPWTGGTDRAVHVPIGRAERVYRAAMAGGSLGSEEGPLSTHYLLTLPDDDAAARTALHETFHVRRAEQVVDVAEVRSQLGAWLQVGEASARGVTALLVLLGLAWIAAMASQRMNRLSRSFGLLRAQGWSAFDVARMALWENVALAAMGWLAALALWLPLRMVLERWALAWGLTLPGVSPGWALTLLGALVAGAVVSVALPLLRLRGFGSNAALPSL